MADFSAEVVDGRRLRVHDGSSTDIEPTWLRDRCACPDCRDIDSGQRLFDILDLPSDLRVASASVTEDEITVEFAPQSHTSVYDIRDLLAADQPFPRGDERSETSKQLWRRADEVAVAPRDWQEYLADPAPTLRQVVSTGFAVLTGTGTSERTVIEVAESFGFVRVTNYGDIFDVRIEPSPINLAFTSHAISPHTDNPYRDPVPTLQLLHCLVSSDGGGQSGLVDGFAAAAELRSSDTEAFAVLTTTPVDYAFESKDAHLAAHAPLIQLDALGRVVGIRFNNRSMRVPRLQARLNERFYAAYRRFAEIVNEPSAQLNFTLTPGDCLIFDNTRLLHARTAFETTGGRHLQGAYADIDGLLSTLAITEATR